MKFLFEEGPGLDVSMKVYTRDSRVEIYPFSRQQDGNEIVIGRVETGVFLALPSEAVEVLDQLARGRSIGEVQDAYAQNYGEALDLDEFLDTLQANGIVKSPQDPDSPEQASSNKSRPPSSRKVSYHFAGFPQATARLFFSWPAIIFSLLLILSALLMLLRNTASTPAPRDLYFPDHRTFSFVTLTLVGYLGLFLHELAHLIAARAAGVNSRLGVSHRLWVLVAETDLTGLWSIPKQKRYLPLFAGMILDCVSCGVLIVLLFLQDSNWLTISPLWSRIVRALVFTYFIRIVWQFLFFIRTDCYFVIANYLSCKNLLGDAEVYLRNLLSRVFPAIKYHDQSGIPARELKVIRMYSVLWLLGRLAALALLFFVTIPIALRYLANFTETFRAGFSAHPSDFVDSLLLTSYFVIPLLIGTGMWINSLLQSRRAAQ